MSMNYFGDIMIDYILFLLTVVIAWRSGKFWTKSIRVWIVKPVLFYNSGIFALDILMKR